MPTTLSAAVPHSNVKDDYYRDYFIPKKSAMMMNVSLTYKYSAYASSSHVIGETGLGSEQLDFYCWGQSPSV